MVKEIKREDDKHTNSENKSGDYFGEWAYVSDHTYGSSTELQVSIRDPLESWEKVINRRLQI